MRYFLKILKEDKVKIKMNNQSDKGFDLIILADSMYGKVSNKLNYCTKRDIEVNVAWEFKSRRNYFKVYKNVKIVKIKENINPFKHKIEGFVITFSCENIDYYADKTIDIGTTVPISTKIYKDTKILYRALKLSNINFDINTQ